MTNTDNTADVILSEIYALRDDITLVKQGQAELKAELVSFMSGVAILESRQNSAMRDAKKKLAACRR